ncbi:hypothetical protein GCM10010172_41160 [Paractinoplanes ferrugineus]|uniref:Uncharacterized protein n=1 Tax=Paractinoplanes ferrugineus TaxID=113564 RepID=A0A919J408_9ACTN|nr:hypothetical protein Afe05nite_39540 [Actinoplanes ferrugineus]
MTHVAISTPVPGNGGGPAGFLSADLVDCRLFPGSPKREIGTTLIARRGPPPRFRVTGVWQVEVSPASARTVDAVDDRLRMIMQARLSAPG